MPSEILNNIKGKRADQKQMHLGRQENIVHEKSSFEIRVAQNNAASHKFRQNLHREF